ncbi:MAG: hypothetical protein GMKNLPBB_01735 [Myxococcota bacterium]|nr:hypothetical protein [Myxococcota bacterium]
MTAFAVAAALLPSGGARAASPREELALGVAAYNDFNYDAATRHFDAVLASPLALQEQRCDALMYLGFTQILNDKPAEADRSLDRWASGCPNSTPPKGISPKLRQRLDAAIARRGSPAASAPAADAAPAASSTASPASSSTSMEINLEERPGVFRRYMGTFICAGVTLVSMGAATGLSLTVNSSKSELDNAARDDKGRVTGVTRARALELEDGAKSKATAANIMWGVSGAALAATGVAFFLEHTASKDSGSAALPVRFGAGVAPNAAMFSLHGSF